MNKGDNMKNIMNVTINVVKMQAPRIKSYEARYLKHMGKRIDTQVSFHVRGSDVMICIRKREFYTFNSAREYLKVISREIEWSAVEGMNDATVSAI